MATQTSTQPPVSNDAWREVMRQVDLAYAELIAHQTELERKNADLEEMRAFMDSVLGAMSDALIVCNRYGRIEQVNRALETLADTEAPDRLVGQPVETLVVESDRIALSEALATASGAASGGAAPELALRNGAVVEMKIAARRDPRKRLLGYVLIGRPIGELRRAYRTLEETHEQLKTAQSVLVQSEKMASLGRLVAGVAHELNNPISYINGNVHAIAKYLKKLETYFQRVRDGADRAELVRLRAELRLDRAVEGLRETVDGAIEGADRVADIVDSLRRFSADARGAPQRFDLAAVARVAAHWVEKGSKRPTVVEIETPQTAEIEGRAGHIQQVLMNLLQNAVDAQEETGAQTPIRMTVWRDAEEACVCVSDAGPGLSDAVAQRLFDPFFTTKPVGQGTGLGLSISFKIVQEHCGLLKAVNRAEGGARFELRLPTKWKGDQCERYADEQSDE